MSGPGWGERIFTFYELQSATALRDALLRFDHGRLVVNMIDMPIKCAVAPLEFCFLADWYLRAGGIRDVLDAIHAIGNPAGTSQTRPTRRDSRIDQPGCGRYAVPERRRCVSLGRVGGGWWLGPGLARCWGLFGE
jgi:hypothetical protein